MESEGGCAGDVFRTVVDEEHLFAGAAATAQGVLIEAFGGLGAADGRRVDDEVERTGNAQAGIESELSKYRESDPDHFLAERRARAQPVLDKMHGWLRQKQNQVPPSMALDQERRVDNREDALYTPASLSNGSGPPQNY